LDFSTEKYKNLPRVVLAGRPNVGKSTLFNRLAHKRRAITSPISGVTRDAVETDVFICGQPVRLIDTGGFKLDREPDIDELVVTRTLETIKSADIVVLILAAGEISAEDEEFIALLRAVRHKLVVCINKTEGGRLIAESYNTLSFGFDEIHFISAEHGDNIAEFSESLIKRLDFSKIEPVTDETPPIKIALTGKPNTGKSTLSNRLTSSSASIVSDIPGTTRDVIEGIFFHKGQKFITLDTAGIRRKNKINEDIEYYSVNHAIKTMDQADIILLLIDAIDGLSDQDKKIAALASERKRAVIFVLNKWDTMPQIKNAFNAARDRLRFLFPKMAYVPVLPVSALTGVGVGALLDTAAAIFKQLTRRTGTAALNELIERWQYEYPPPSGPATRFKIKYGLQISDNPVIFKLFVSRPRAWTESYGAYITNKLRKDAGYTMIPISLEIESSRKERRGT
jgi:GTP-binding protein